MRFLATGDLQIRAWQQFSYTRSNGMNSRLYNCLRVFDILLKEAKERRIKKILLNGDIFEDNTYIDVEAYDATYLKLEKLHSRGLETVINLGNHDISAQLPGRMLHSLRPFRKVARIVEEPKRIWDRLQVVPWMGDPEEFKKVVAGLDARKELGLVLHCGVQGARAGPTRQLIRNPIHLRDIRHREYGLVILSDYHTHQWLAPNVFYTGSPIQHSFGETHRPAIWEVHLLDKPPWFRVTKINTPFPRFRRVHVRRLRDLKEKLGDFTGHYVRITIHPASKVSDKDVEDLSRGKFLYRIERRGGEVESAHESVNALRPEEAISRYVNANVVQKAKRQRLIFLGGRLYKGEG